VSGWTTDAILAAAAAWVWVPANGRQVLTDDYQLVTHPDRSHPYPVKVAWSRSQRPVGELISEVAAQARAWGQAQVYWEISGTTRPADTEAALLERGAALADSCQLLAYDMTYRLPVLDVPAGVHCQVIRDEPDLRAGLRVHAEVWGDGREPAEDGFAREFVMVRESLATWSGFRVVAFLGREPASYGGCELAGGAARLWGAATRPAFRGQGTYRAVLARRLEVARMHGATLALAKGRAQTSVPILRRAGFAVHGEERCYRLDV
jgi:GNAT superfamily N-acetyltransferase